MTYATTDGKDLAKLGKLIDQTLRYKLKLPTHINTEVIYMHEDAGGIGQDKIEDLVNIDRLVLLLKCLNQNNEMGIIMQGAVERLKDYSGISTNPLSTNVTQDAEKPRGM